MRADQNGAISTSALIKRLQSRGQHSTLHHRCLSASQNCLQEQQLLWTLFRSRKRANFSWNSNTFDQGPLDLSRTTLVYHSLDTGDAHPVRQTPHRLLQAKLDIAEKEVKAMAEAGIIEPSSSRWAPSIILVFKRDGRYCIDYRKAKDLTQGQITSPTHA